MKVTKNKIIMVHLLNYHNLNTMVSSLIFVWHHGGQSNKKLEMTVQRYKDQS